MKKIYKNNSLAQQGITSKEKLQHRLQEIFEHSEHQESALIGIYKLVFPDWEEIKQIEGFPQIGRELWGYIANLFIDFDQCHHVQVFKGGLWVNNGFGSSDKLDGWEISLENCKVIYA